MPESERESPFLKRARAIESPLPHLAGAATSLKRIISLQRELFTLEATLRARAQLKRLLLAVVAISLGEGALLLGFFWIFQGLREAGWSPLWLALLAFVALGAPAFIFARLALSSSPRLSPEAQASRTLRTSHEIPPITPLRQRSPSRETRRSA